MSCEAPLVPLNSEGAFSTFWDVNMIFEKEIEKEREDALREEHDRKSDECYDDRVAFHELEDEWFDNQAEIAFEFHAERRQEEADIGRMAREEMAARRRNNLWSISLRNNGDPSPGYFPWVQKHRKRKVNVRPRPTYEDPPKKW
jgi:hypothetical protein